MNTSVEGTGSSLQPSRFSLEAAIWFTVVIATSVAFVAQAMEDNLGAQVVMWGLALSFSLAVLLLRWQISRIALLMLIGLFIVGVAFNWYTISWLLCGCLFSIVTHFRKRSAQTTMRAMAGWYFVATLTGNILTATWIPPRLHRLLEAREAYPIEDLRGRLSKYDSSRMRKGSAVPFEGSFDVPLMTIYARKNQGTYRDHYLELIHDKAYERFVRTLGFGAARMDPIQKELVRLPAIENIPFGDIYTESWHTNHSKEWYEPFPLKALETIDLSSEENVLIRSYFDFLNPGTFGWIPEPQKSAGFEPHAFRVPFTSLSLQQKYYSVGRLELVGVLLRDEPRVYVSDYLPRMDQLSAPDAKTRPLDEFEAAALERLWQGEHVVVQKQDKLIKMLGAIRSLPQCAQCHENAMDGELLGAFSYDLLSR